MGKLNRAYNMIGGIFVIILAILLLVGGEDSYFDVAIILGWTMTLRGLSLLLYYIGMARHAVGGRTILFKGVIFFDLGLFILGISDMYPEYVMLYLAIIYAFGGAVDILRALEAKRFAASLWKIKLIAGIGSIAIAVICIINIKSVKLMVIIYCAGLIYSAIMRIRMAREAKNSTLIYIP